MHTSLRRWPQGGAVDDRLASPTVGSHAETPGHGYPAHKDAGSSMTVLHSEPSSGGR